MRHLARIVVLAAGAAWLGGCARTTTPPDAGAPLPEPDQGPPVECPAEVVVRCGTEDQLFRHDPFTGDDPELLAGCHEYLGSFWRTSTLGAEDLRPLRSVLIIRGDAHVNGLYSLLSLTGTECLTEVGGDLSLAWLRHDFLDVDGLHALRRVGGDVAIVANA